MERPEEIQSKTKRIKTGCGKVYVTISLSDEPYKEMFLRLGKSGGCAAAFLDGIGRLISLAHISDEIVIKAFGGIRCPHNTHDMGREILSCLDGVAKLLEKGEAK